MWSDEIAKSIVLGLIIFAIVMFCFGGLVVWGLPKLLLILKPIIHVMTA